MVERRSGMKLIFNINRYLIDLLRNKKKYGIDKKFIKRDYDNSKIYWMGLVHGKEVQQIGKKLVIREGIMEFEILPEWCEVKE